jgi:flagellar biosynthesis regulator FlbT
MIPALPSTKLEGNVIENNRTKTPATKLYFLTQME